MTKIKTALFAWGLLGITTMALVQAAAGNYSAKDILAQVDKVSHTSSSKMLLTQTVITPSGAKRSFKMLSYSMNGNEKSLTEYLAPNQVRGMKILTLNDGDDIWTWFPRTNRVRKIASSARNRKVQGSDFTYDDMASGKMAKSWHAKLAGEESIGDTKCYKLSLVPSASGPKSYLKAMAWINKSTFATVRVEYFDLDGDKIKRLDIKSYKKVNGVLVPFRYVMTNLTDGGTTTMQVAKAEVNIKLNAQLFTEAGLGR